MHIIPRGQKGDNKFMLISLNQQFPTEPSSTAKFSRSTIGNSHAVPSVHLRHYTRLDSFKHAILAPFSPLGSFFFLTFKCLYRVLKAIMFSSICPIYPAPSWLQSSFHQWVWTHKCWHRDYLPCEEQFNQINLWEIPSASSLQSPTVKDWHNLRAYGICSLPPLPGGRYLIPQVAQSCFPNWAWLLCNAHPPTSGKGQSWRTRVGWGRRLLSFSTPRSWQPCSLHGSLW